MFSHSLTSTPMRQMSSSHGDHTPFTQEIEKNQMDRLLFYQKQFNRDLGNAEAAYLYFRELNR